MLELFVHNIGVQRISAVPRVGVVRSHTGLKVKCLHELLDESFSLGTHLFRQVSQNHHGLLGQIEPLIEIHTRVVSRFFLVQLECVHVEG